MSTLLSPDDLRTLTGYRRAAEQRRKLDEYGIPYKKVGSRTIVLRDHISAWVEGRKIRQHVEPDLSMVR